MAAAVIAPFAVRKEVRVQRELNELWMRAKTLDRTLRVTTDMHPALRRKEVHARPYARAEMLDGMQHGRINLFTGVPVWLDTVDQSPSGVADAIAAGFTKRDVVRCKLGPAWKPKSMSVSQAIERWKRGRGVMTVTDLHFRGTKLDRSTDTSALSDFNILDNRKSRISVMEMMTLVISSRDAVTDSLSDDCDGSNHCFVGEKLWLAWDRLAGKRVGLQDVTFDDVRGAARFNMRAFLSLPSARWFVVGAGQTLFLPGNLTHKVITLESYIGLGSFYVSLPNVIPTVSRWVLDGSTDVAELELLEPIVGAAKRQLGGVRTRRDAERWGVRHFKESAQAWRQRFPSKKRQAVLQVRGFPALLNAGLQPRKTSDRRTDAGLISR